VSEVAEMNEEVQWPLAALASTRSRLEELAMANRRKDEFLATLAHELRSPLTSIRNAALILGSQWCRGPGTGQDASATRTPGAAHEATGR